MTRRWIVIITGQQSRYMHVDLLENTRCVPVVSVMWRKTEPGFADKNDYTSGYTCSARKHEHGRRSKCRSRQSASPIKLYTPTALGDRIDGPRITHRGRHHRYRRRVEPVTISDVLQPAHSTLIARSSLSTLDDRLRQVNRAYRS